jgi:hypothetical protein
MARRFIFRHPTLDPCRLSSDFLNGAVFAGEAPTREKHYHKPESAAPIQTLSVRKGSFAVIKTEQVNGGSYDLGFTVAGQAMGYRARGALGWRFCSGRRRPQL